MPMTATCVMGIVIEEDDPDMQGTKNQAALDAIANAVRTCTMCPLSATANNKVPGAGTAAADVMLIGEAPGAQEDQTGVPFVGAAGKQLDTLLAEAGIDRSRAYVANVLKCRPPRNRDPRPEEIELCTRHLHAQVEAIAPKVIITLGAFATRNILSTTQGITAMRGRAWTISTWPDVVIVPTFHPAAAIYDRSKLDFIRADFVLARQIMDSLGIA